MHDIYAYYPVSGWQISSAAENTTGRIAAIDNLKGLLTSTQQKAVNAAEGELVTSLANSPTSAQAHADDITRKATFAAGALELFATYVNTYDFDSSAPRSVSKLNSAYFSAENADFGQPATTYPSGATPAEKQKLDSDWSDGYSAKRQALMKTLNGEYAQLGSNLDTNAAHVSSVLKTGPTDATIKELYASGALPSNAYLIWPNINFSLVPITALPYDLRNLTPDQLAAWLLKHPEVPKTIVDKAVTLPGVATSVGNMLADQAKSVTSFDSAGLKQFAALYAEFSQYDAVNAAMFNSLGGKGTLQVLSKISQTEDARQNLTDDQKNLLAMLKSGLQSATNYPSFDSQTFAHDLVKAATMDPEDMYKDPLAQGYTGAMSYLLYNGKFGDTFISTVADDLDTYERLDNDGHLHLWSNRDNSFYNGQYHWDDMLPYEARNASSDPMISLMSALSNSPKADLSFFDGGGDSNNDGVPDRQEYYIKDRIWDGDGFLSISKALDTATTNPGLITDPSTAKDAATLASATVNLFSQRRYLDADIDKMSLMTGDDDAGKHFAHILSTYMDGVDQAEQNKLPPMSKGFDSGTIWSTEFHSNLSNVPVFSLEAVQKFSHAAMSTDDGLIELRNGLNNYEALKLGAGGDYLADHPDDPAAKSSLTQSVYRDADLEGLFMNELGDSKIAEAKGKDETIGSWIDMGKNVVDLIPLPGAKVVGGELEKGILDLAVSTGKDDGVDALKEQFAHYETDEIAKQNSDATGLLNQQEYSVAKTLFAHDLAANPQAIIDDGSAAVTKDANGDYQLISFDDFSKLSGATKQQVLSEIYSPEHGIGQTFDRGEYETRYSDKFHSYF